MEKCIFCQIVSGESKAFRIWEDENHLAFLSIYPNTPGVTVVIPKTHYSSYAFALKDEVLSNLILATKQVAQLLDARLENVARTAMVLEGFGVDHVHAKLFPLHGTGKKEDPWHQRTSNVDKFFEQYEGYVSSHDYHGMDDQQLKEIADLLTKIKM